MRRGPSGSGVSDRRLREIVARLGLLDDADVGPVCERVVRLTGGAFVLPLDDPAYHTNSLCPGGWPVEVSFSQSEPAAVRFDLAPLDPAASAPDRAAAAVALAEVPAAAVAPWSPALLPRRFGGFVGTVVLAGPQAPALATKAYLELDHAAGPGDLPEPFDAWARDLARYVPGIEPHFVALAGGAGGAAPRVYFECGTGLALLALLDWAAAHGLAAVAPALIDAVRRLTGGRLVLPEASVLVAIRPVGVGAELKIELTRQILVEDCAGVLGRLLVDAPAAQASYQRWRAAIEPVTSLSVASVRIAPGMSGPRLNAYAGLFEQGPSLASPVAATTAGVGRAR